MEKKVSKRSVITRYHVQLGCSRADRSFQDVQSALSYAAALPECCRCRYCKDLEPIFYKQTTIYEYLG